MKKRKKSRQKSTEWALGQPLVFPVKKQRTHALAETAANERPHPAALGNRLAEHALCLMDIAPYRCSGRNSAHDRMFGRMEMPGRVPARRRIAAAHVAARLALARRSPNKLLQLSALQSRINIWVTAARNVLHAFAMVKRNPRQHLALRPSPFSLNDKLVAREGAPSVRPQRFCFQPMGARRIGVEFIFRPKKRLGALESHKTTASLSGIPSGLSSGFAVDRP